jgi:hypothetical protein
MSGTITDTSHRTVRQLIVVVSAPTIPGDNGWLNQLFFDGTSADQASLVNYHFDPFNQMRFRVVSDRSYILNSRKQADLSDTK